VITHKTDWKIPAAEALLAKHCSRIPTVARYTLNVLIGNVAVGRMVFLSVERFLNDLQRASSRSANAAEGGKPGRSDKHDNEPAIPGNHDFPYYFDQGGAVSIIKYFRDLCPFKLEPFQQFIVANLFGWKKAGIHCIVHPNGHRRFQTAYIEIGKGSGKTPLAAGIGTYLTCADGEPGAEIYVAAPSKEQAAICFRDSVRIVDGDEEHQELRKIFKQFGCSGKMLSGNLSAGTSFMRPVSAEHKTLDGPRPHGVIADELHEHPNVLVLDKLTAGFKARHQPLAFEITNSGWDRETIARYHHDYSRQILDKVIVNDAWFAYVCQLDVCDECHAKGKESPSCDNCDNWLDPDPAIRQAVWLKANPGLGTILQVEYLEKQVKEALEIPATRNLKLRLNFCIWTQSDERFISPEAWRRCGFEQEDMVA
jgi:phage terminase large subunit-like protein